LIALDRFILSTGTKNKYFIKFAQIDLKVYLVVTFVLSLISNSINLFEYKYEVTYESVQFPIISANFFNFYFIYPYLNILNFLFSNFALLLLQLIIDIALLSFFKTSQNKKNTILKPNKTGANSNMCKDGSKYEKKIKLMIILNGILHSMFHSPDLLVAIFMATTDFKIYEKNFDREGNSFKKNYALFINILSILSDIIYISSYSFNFFLYFYFNAIFYKSFIALFFVHSSTKKI
jgi:hypothetical protein